MPNPGQSRTQSQAPPRSSAEPEILHPRSGRGADLFSDSNLDMLAHLLDDFLRIPGTNIRFGLDGIVGLIPGIGDVLGAMASWIIILAAWLRGVPKVTLARMLVNVAIETIVGSVPVLGDAFDIAWKANRRNFELLQRSSSSGYAGASAAGYAGASGNGDGGMPAAGYAGTNVPTQMRLGSTPQQRHRHAISDWLFLGALFLGMLLLLAIPIALLAFLAGKFLAMGLRH